MNFWSSVYRECFSPSKVTKFQMIIVEKELWQQGKLLKIFLIYITETIFPLKDIWGIYKVMPRYMTDMDFASQSRKVIVLPPDNIKQVYKYQWQRDRCRKIIVASLPQIFISCLSIAHITKFY